MIKFRQKPENHVKKKLPVQPQLEMFKTVLSSFINSEHELCQMAKRIERASLEKEFDVLYRVLTQKRDDSSKVYSVHEPEVLCISKGKEHKPYELGNKSSFAHTRGSGIIVGAMAVKGNAYMMGTH